MEKLWWPEYTLPEQDKNEQPNQGEVEAKETKGETTSTSNSNLTMRRERKARTEKGNEKIDFSLDEISKINEVEKTYNQMLKHSCDYQSLTKAIHLLQGQREQVVKAIDTIENQKEGILKAPLNYIQKLKSNRAPLFPTRFKVLDLPNINFDNRLEFLDRYVEAKDKEKSSNSRSVRRLNRNSKRIRNEGWTEEEETQLNQILDTLDPELDLEIKAEHIVQQILTKSVDQVTEFLTDKQSKIGETKLEAVPTQPEDQGKKPRAKKPRRLRFDNGSKLNLTRDIHSKRSSQNPIPRIQNQSLDSSSETSSTRVVKLEDHPPYVPFSEPTVEAVIHLGYRCTLCRIEPIVGIRWSCSLCLDLELCDKCKLKPELKLQFPKHNLQHKLQPTKVAQTNPMVDLDYQVKGNYLLEG